MSFLNLADQEDVGDYTDVLDGRDIIVTTEGKETTKTDYNKSSIMLSMKTSPLTKDKALLEKWLDEQTEPIELFSKMSYNDMKTVLQEFVESLEGDEEEEEVEEVKSKPSVSKIDKLFEDKD